LHVLQAIGGVKDFGVEDKSLAAFIAARGTPGANLKDEGAPA
jgi:hypothetical protein